MPALRFLVTLFSSRSNSAPAICLARSGFGSHICAPTMTRMRHANTFSDSGVGCFRAFACPKELAQAACLGCGTGVERR
eukprot:1516829-Pleurochrysis_carterae.AAC.1